MSLKTRRLTIRVPEDLWTRLHYRAEVEGLPFSAVLRRDVSQANARWRPPAPSTSGLSLTWETNAHPKRGEDTMNRESSHDDQHEPDHNVDEASRRAPRDTAPSDQEPDEPAEDNEDFVDEHTAWFYESEPSPTATPDEAAKTVRKHEVPARWVRRRPWPR